MSDNTNRRPEKKTINVRTKIGSERTHANVPVTIRRNVEDFDDPYIPDESIQDHTVCKRCGDTFINGRWVAHDQVPKKLPKETHSGLCPACQKERDKVPSGVLTLGGNFLWAHKDEIMSLIGNETKKAQDSNSLERIMGIEENHKHELVITTNNEKLVQRIGKALNKAYSGHIEYQWSGDNKTARVNWFRAE